MYLRGERNCYEGLDEKSRRICGMKSCDIVKKSLESVSLFEGNEILMARVYI